MSFRSNFTYGVIMAGMGQLGGAGVARNFTPPPLGSNPLQTQTAKNLMLGSVAGSLFGSLAYCFPGDDPTLEATAYLIGGVSTYLLTQMLILTTNHTPENCVVLAVAILMALSTFSSFMPQQDNHVEQGYNRLLP